MNLESKSCLRVFRNKDLIRHTLENLDLIQIRSVARTNKSFLEAADTAKYVHGLILEAGPYPKVFLEDELDFGKLELDISSYKSIVPPLGSKINSLIAGILITTIPVVQELESSASPIIEKIHPMLAYNDFSHVTDIYFSFRNINLAAVQGWEGLSRHTKKATYVAMREYINPEIWNHLNFKKVCVLDIDQPMWFGTFALPENANFLPRLQALLVEFCNIGEPQEVDLSRLNSFPSLVLLQFTFVNQNDQFPTTLTLPSTLSYVRYLRVADIEGNFSNDCKTKIQDLVDACPNLMVFSSNEGSLLDIKLLRNCERKTEEEFDITMELLNASN